MEAQQGLCMLQTHFGVGADSGEQKRGTSGDEQFSRKQGETGQQIEYEYHPNKNVKSITYYKNNVKHREDGPAYVEYLKDGKTLQFERYFINGNLHRDSDAPAWISYSNGDLYAEQYYMHGVKHRSGGPAFIQYLDQGEISREDYYRDGQLHRDDGPALILYHYRFGDSRPEIEDTRYWLNGIQMTLKEDPAEILDKVYDDQNRLVMKVYYDPPKKNGNWRHLISRDNGPAVIRYDKDGNVEYEGYWYRGTQFDTKDDYYDRIHFQLLDVPVPYRYVDETAKSMYDAQKLGLTDLLEDNETKSLEYWKQYVKDQLLEQERDKAEEQAAGRLMYRYGTSVFAKKAPKQ